MDLRYFINQCEAADELHRVKAEVDWNMEISHVSKLTEEKKGPALFFENIKRLQHAGVHRRLRHHQAPRHHARPAARPTRCANRPRPG